MVDVVFLEGLVISMLIGALLGFEREYSKKQVVIGLRSFSLASLLVSCPSYSRTCLQVA